MSIIRSNPVPFLVTFRARMVMFISVIMLITAIALSFFNQRIEQRTTLVVGEYIRDITLATDIVYRSFSSGKYLYDLVNRGEPDGLTIDGGSVIRHILVVDQAGMVFDSSNQADLNQPYSSLIEDLPGQPQRLRFDEEPVDPGLTRTLRFSIETERGVRRIFIVISMNRLNQVKKAGERVRLIVLSLLGLGLIAAIAIFTRRFTRPITGLGEAARRVTAGELDFVVPVEGPHEVRHLATTFNDMLAGLRRNRDLEEKLQRSERSAVVGRLASGIAHEIRNPLNFINLSIDYIRDKYAPTDETGRSEYTRILTTIKDELARLNRLVSDFLGYGRPARLKRRDLDAIRLIEELADLVGARAAQQNVEIRIVGPSDGSASFAADPEQLKTCFSNLIINAVQAMPDGGLLTISLHAEPELVRIDFVDTGHGMTEEMCQQVFEPYFSTRETGIGLGLALTRKIVEEHGGSISVQSAPGEGTAFHLTLPRIAPDPSQSS
jgi:signal transduction histidine kinase